MILIFHAPPLTGGQGLCHIVYVISIVQNNSEKYKKILSYHDLFSRTSHFLYFSEFLWTINYSLQFIDTT